MRCDIEGDGSHYWIVLDNGQEIDITADQFGEKEIRLGSSIVPREQLIDNANTTSRYKVLFKEVRKLLRNEPEGFATESMQ